MERELLAQINAQFYQNHTKEREFLELMDSLSNEELRAVLVLLDVNELINIRTECTRVLPDWVNIIDGIIRQKRVKLIITRIGDANGKSISKLTQDYNGLADFNKDCVHFKLKSNNGKISLSKEFTVSLIEQFNNVENLLFNSPLDLSCEKTTSTQVYLLSLLDHWSASIVTLNLPTDNDTNYKLHDQIDRLTSLRRLYFRDLNHLESTTLARLEHCFYLETYHIGKAVLPNCTSLYSHADITKLKPLNAPLVNRLTHLGLETVDPAVFPFICSNFIALQILNIGLYSHNGLIFSENMIKDLARLQHLSKLSISGLQIDLFAVSKLSTLAQTDLENKGYISNSIQNLTLSVNNFYTIGENFSGDQLCQFLAKIFPNLEKLTIIYKDGDRQVEEEISQHLKHLASLRQHQIISPYKL